MIFRIISNGDPSVGIFGDETKLEVDLSGFDGEDKKEAVKLIGSALQETFSELWDDCVKVYVEDENFNNQNNDEDECPWAGDLPTWDQYIKKL